MTSSASIIKALRLKNNRDIRHYINNNSIKSIRKSINRQCIYKNGQKCIQISLFLLDATKWFPYHMTWFMGLQTILHRQNHFCQSAAICLLFQYLTKMIMYAVRTGMWKLKTLCLTGCLNRKVALRKETSALFVLEVCFFQYHIGTESRSPFSSFHGKSSVSTKLLRETKPHIHVC